MKNYTLKTVLYAAFLVVPSCVVFVGLIFFSMWIWWKPSGNNSPVNSSTSITQTETTQKQKEKISYVTACSKAKSHVEKWNSWRESFKTGQCVYEERNDDYKVTVKCSYIGENEYGRSKMVYDEITVYVDKYTGFCQG